MPKLGRRHVLAAGVSLALSALAGCSGDGGSDDPTDRGPVTVEEVAFAADRPAGYDDYESQPEATYGPDDVVWIYVALSDLSGIPVDDSDGADEQAGTGDEEQSTDDGGSQPVDDGDNQPADGDDAESTNQGNASTDVTDRTEVEIDLVQTVSVEDPDGAVVARSEETVQQTLVVGQLDSFFVATDVIHAGTVASGTYTVSLTYRDRVSASETTATATFEIES